MDPHKAKKFIASLIGVKTADLMNQHILNAIEVDREQERKKDKRNAGAAAPIPIPGKKNQDLPIDRLNNSLNLSRDVHGERNQTNSLLVQQNLGNVSKHYTNYDRVQRNYHTEDFPHLK